MLGRPWGYKIVLVMVMDRCKIMDQLRVLHSLKQALLICGSQRYKIVIGTR